MDGSLVYRKSGLGAAQLVAPHTPALSPRERQVLILLNGRRTIEELSDLLGAETLRRVVHELEAKGFAKRVDPQLPAEWANAITQLHVPSPDRERPRRARDLRSDGHLLVRIALLVVLTTWGCYWVADRYRSQADAWWRFNQPLAQTRSIDALGVPTLTDAIDADRSEPAAPVTIAPISRLPAARVPPAAATSPAHAAPHVVPQARQAIARVESRPAAQPQTTASSAERPPAAQSSPAFEPAAAPPAPESSPALEPAAAPPAAESPPALEPPSAASTSATATQVAMQASPAQPVSNPVALRPLRHDAPLIPGRAQHDGIVEGHARVRLWVTPEGKVDQVDILEATPSGVLDDEVRRVLSLWTFDPPGHPTDEVIELTLKP
jgi:protein TonB